MKATCLSLFILLINTLFVFGQQAPIDSLITLSNDPAQQDSIRIQALKAIIIQQKYYDNKLDSALLLGNRMIVLAQKSDLKKWEAEGNRLQGFALYYNGQYEKAIDFYQRSLSLLKSINEQKRQGVLLYNIAVAYRLLGDLPKSLEYNLEALTIRRLINDQKGEAISLQSIATVYYNQNKLQEALKFGLEGFELSKKLDYNIGMANAAVSIANAYSDLEKYSEGLTFYNIALPIYEEFGRSRNQATCYDNIGNLHFKQKDFLAAGKFHGKALEMRKKSKDKKGLALSYINLGSTLFELGRYSEAITHCKQGLSFAEETNGQRLIYNACECLYQGYEKTGDFKNAFTYYQFYITAKDAMEGVEKTKLVEEIESKYELKEKEALLSQQELDIVRERNKRFATIIISILVLGLFLGLFVWLRNRLQNRRLAAEQLAKREQEETEKLRELDRLKSSFFTNISHEIRTPLTLIMSPLQQMIDGSLKGDPQKYQQIMYRNGKRLQDLINQLLDLSKLESGHLHLNLQCGNLSQFLRNTALSFNSLADRKQIEYQIDGPLDHITAEYDKDVLEKILMNLISNAFKFTPEEGQISVSFEVEHDQLKFIIVDSGIGIPKDQLDSIFNRFYSSESTSDLQMSSGIGLALTKELVDLHDGSISVESVDGKGSCFKVVLFLDKVKFEQRTTNDLPPLKVKGLQENIALPQKIPPSKEASILLVEDNNDVRHYLKEQLQEKYNILQAADGQIGLSMAHQFHPELIISDVMMPKMNGQELCTRLKTDPVTSHIPVILLTAKAEQQDKLAGLETGADVYLTKPFDQKELQLHVRNLIRQRVLLHEKFRSNFQFVPSEISLSSIDATFLEDIRRIVESNLEDETFSVLELSKEVGMSRSNLFRKLKALTDQSPNQIIREMRLIRAKSLLEKGAGNSAEVAFMVGFNSATYFTKCFGDHFGFPPSQVKLQEHQ